MLREKDPASREKARAEELAEIKRQAKSNRRPKLRMERDKVEAVDKERLGKRRLHRGALVPLRDLRCVRMGLRLLL